MYSKGRTKVTDLKFLLDSKEVSSRFKLVTEVYFDEGFGRRTPKRVMFHSFFRKVRAGD